MLKVQHCAGGYFKVSLNGRPIHLDVDLQCTTEVFELSKKKYFRAHVHGTFVDLLRSIDGACGFIQNYKSCMNDDNTILIKVPYRYKRFEVDFHNGTHSGFLAPHCTIHATLEGSGVFSMDNFAAFSFKLKEVHSANELSV